MSNANVVTRIVALAGRPDERNVGEAMVALAAYLRSRGVRVRVAAGEQADFGPYEVDIVPETDLAPGADFIVAVGGDGTLMHAARMAAAHGVPVMGVNRGRLGFLADVSPARMLESVDDALEGRCAPETRLLLQATVSGDGVPNSSIALNDVAVAKHESGRMVELETRIDGRSSIPMAATAW